MWFNRKIGKKLVYHSRYTNSFAKNIFNTERRWIK